ncbi:site-specific recombinase XerC [Opitutaceae bacterium TAV1]|nr:site-specific recombinase XerC [Opitutaceae bacterium TAV1]
MEIARRRFAEHKSRVERTRKAARAAGTGSGTMHDLLVLLRAQVSNRADISPNTRARTLREIAYVEKTWPEFPKLRPDEITRTAVASWKNRALKEGTGFRPPGARESTPTTGKSPRSFNGGLSVVRQLLDMAVENGALHANPLAGRRIGLRARDTPRRPILPSREKVCEIFAEIERGSGIAGQGIEVADFCRGLAVTGCRLQEAAGIQWGHVRFDRGTVVVNGTKTEASRREVPMIPAARALLEKIRARRERAGGADPADPVFLVREAEKSLTRACKAVGVQRLTHHDLRDVFATTCIEAGIDIPTVAGWMGHSDGGALLMKVYAHLRHAHSIEAAAKVVF